MSKWSSAYRDSRWQRKRLAVMERDGFVCKSCGKDGPDAALAVHHTYYDPGTAPWEYPDAALVTWCEECHDARHLLARCISVAVAKMDIDYAKRIAAMIASESPNLELLARVEASGASCVAVNNLLRFALKNGGGE